jgi:hypothetical protein
MTGQIGNLVPEIGGRGLPPSMQILLNEGLYDRIKQLSVLMSKAQGMTPAHLLGKGEACFSIINMALDWKLSWHFVARHTYQTPSGSIGFDGALVQAILERSGQFVGGPSLEYRGNWESLNGKFEVKQGQRGGSFAVPTWASKDAVGLGIIVRWKVRGEEVPRVWPSDSTPFWLTQCFPLNSPLWATDPKTQIAYLAIRRFANLTSPGILGGAAFDDDALLDASDRAIDVSEPRRADFAQQPTDDRPELEVVDLEGVTMTYRTGADAGVALLQVLQDAAALGLARLEGAWESNEATIGQMEREGYPNSASVVATQYRQLRAELNPAQAAPAHQGTTSSAAAGVEPRPGVSQERPDAAVSGGTTMVSQPSDQAAQHRGGGAKEAQGGPQTGVSPGPANDTTKPDPNPGAPRAAQGGAVREQPFPGDVNRAPAEEQRPAGDREVKPPLREGRPDYRTWAVALMGPKIKQQKTSDDLALLLGDNYEHTEAAREQLIGANARIIGELDEVIAQQWRVIRGQV